MSDFFQIDVWGGQYRKDDLPIKKYRHYYSNMPLRSPTSAFMLLIWLFAWSNGAPASAATSDSLVELVRSFYVPYLVNDPDREPPVDTDVIAAHATAHLKMLIARYNACEDKTHEICGLDFGVIINGQDWDLQRPPLVTVRKDQTNEYIVSSHFENAGVPNQVNYIFVNQNGEWLIDDMTGTEPGAPDWRLTDMISAAQ